MSEFLPLELSADTMYYKPLPRAAIKGMGAQALFEYWHRNGLKPDHCMLGHGVVQGAWQATPEIAEIQSSPVIEVDFGRPDLRLVA